MRFDAVRLTVCTLVLSAAFDASAATTIHGTSWFPVGPAPTAQGQAYGGGSVDVSGRGGPIAINPQNTQEIWLGTPNGGVWQTTDGGQHWKPRSDDLDSLAIGAVLLDGCAHDGCATVYIGTGENGIRRDTYRGAGLFIGHTTGGEFPEWVWTPSGANIFRNGSINNIVKDGSNLFVTLSSGETASASESTVTAPAPAQGYGIFKFDGTNWTKLNVAGSNNAKPTTLRRDPQNGALLAGFLGRGIFKSVDGGTTWCPLNPGISVSGCPAAPGLPNISLNFDFVEIDIHHPSNAQPAVIYASFGFCGDPIAADCGNGIWRSADGGATWTQKLTQVPGSTGIQAGCPRGYSRYTHVLKVDPTNSDHVYLGGWGLCLSTDGASTFNTLLGPLHPDQHDLAFDPNDASHLFSSNDGGLYEFAGGTWNSLNDDLQITEFQSLTASPNTSTIIGGTQDNGTMRWIGSRVWQHIDGGDSASTIIDLGNSNQYYDLYVRQCPRSNHGSGGGAFSFIGDGLGVDYSACFYDFVYPEAAAFYPPITQDPISPFPVYIGTIKLYRWNTGASHWDQVSPDLSGGGAAFPDIGTPNVISSIAVARTSHNIVYLGFYNGAIWVSDSGTGPCTTMSCWHQINSGTPAAPVSRIAVDPNDAGTVYATFSGFTGGAHLFKKAGGGAWTATDASLPQGVPINTISIEVNDTQRLWVGTDDGIYRTINGGAHWDRFSDGLPRVPVYEIALDETRGRAWAGTHGRGAFVLTQPFLSNLEGWVNGGIWDIPVFGNGFLANQTCTMKILRQDGTTCASGSHDGNGGTIQTDDMGRLTTNQGSMYQGQLVAWGCLNGHCVEGANIAGCNQPGNPITSVIVTCGGQVAIEHVTGCQQQGNPPTSITGLDGTPAGPGGAAGPLGAPALPNAPQPGPPPAGGEQRAFFIVPTVQAGDGSTRALCTVRVPFTVGEDRGRVIERARDLINASATCAANGVTARATGIFPNPSAAGEDVPAFDPHLVISAPPVQGSQLMPAVQSAPGQAVGLCFDVQGLGVAASNQLEITRVRFATAPGGAAGGKLRLTEVSALGTCQIDVPLSAGWSATQIASNVAAAFNTPGIPGPYRTCPSSHNPRDVVQDGDSVLTVLPYTVRICVGDPRVGITIQPDELQHRYPVANAGGDREVNSTSVTFNGSQSSDPDSTPGTNDGIVSYIWSDVLSNGTVVPLGSGPIVAANLAPGSHHVVLRVTNKAALSDTATALIAVLGGGGFGLSALTAGVDLSQAYARSSKGVIFGIPTSGTTDYRDLALRLRFDATPHDSVTVMLRNQRLALDPRPQLRSDIDLEWGFYQRRFNSGLALRAGRAPIPIGVWNDRREEGTSLPFFTAPAAVYQEGGAINESVDGVTATYRQPLPAAFKLDLLAYGGGWDKLEEVPATAIAGRARSENALGARAWLITPIAGLRFGLAANRYTVRDGLLRVSSSDDWRTILLTADGSFPHWDVRAEYLAARHPLAISGIGFPTVDSDGGYAEAGIALTPRLWLHAQVEFQHADFKRPAHPTIGVNIDRNFGAVLDYKAGQRVVLKLEGHRDRGFLTEDHGLDLLNGSPVTVRYGVLTCAVRF
jgi:photosystem II stability/assembly factor-like uncharacterized protein